MHKIRKRSVKGAFMCFGACNGYLILWRELVKHLGIKKLPDYGQGATQMFSQRNNPYCELLSVL